MTAAGNREKNLRDQRVAGLHELQSRDDPMGITCMPRDAHGSITDTRDPDQIRDLFENAAQKRSSDTRIVLGRFYFSGVAPGRDTRPY
jgi:hypothetical protein